MNLGNAAPWDFVANGYAKSMVPVLARFSAEAISATRLNSSDVVADIACGPGTVSVAASPLVRQVKPNMIVSDHGTEFASNAILAWSKDPRPHAATVHAGGRNMQASLFDFGVDLAPARYPSPIRVSQSSDVSNSSAPEIAGWIFFDGLVESPAGYTSSNKTVASDG